MGQARERSIRGGEVIIFKLAAPVFNVSQADRENLRRDPEGGDDDEARIVPGAVRLTIANCVGAAFPQGMDRRDGKAWEVWQDVIIETENEPTVLRADVEWLHKHVAREDLKVPIGLIGWREGLLTYMNTVLAEPKPAALSDKADGATGSAADKAALLAEVGAGGPLGEVQ